MSEPAPVTQLLSKLVGFESLSHQEKEVADFVFETLSRSLPDVRRFGNNVIATLGSGGRALLLNSHLDVVPASADHPYPPFEATIASGRLYGRGSVDAKASVASMMTAVMELAARGWHPPAGSCLVLALTDCEEIGGGYNGLEATRPHLPPLGAAIIGEPTGLAPCTAQKGMLIVEAVAHGKTAHAARPHLGKNAIEIAARDITRLAGLQFEREHALLGRTVANATVIQGGKSHNVIPDRCNFTIDARLTPEYPSDEVVERLRETLDSELRVRSDRYVPVETPRQEQIVRVAVSVSGKQPFGSATASDWVYVRDVPVVKIGPGDSNLSHTGGESISLAELQTAPDVYRGIVEGYFREKHG